MALTSEDISTINQLIADFIGENKTKVSALPDATTLTGLSILGLSEGISVKASMALLKGLDGKNPEFRKTTTEIQWRLVGGATWTKLVDLSDIRGFKTALQKTSTEIQWKYENDATWTTLLSLSELKGDKGDPGYTPVITDNYWYINGVNTGIKAIGEDGLQIELQKTATHIQWRLGTGSWANLVSLADLKGVKGDTPNITIGTVQDGANAGATITGTTPNLTLNLTLPKGDTGSNIELQKTATHVQWRVVGGTWANLIPLTDLKGEKGDNIELQKTATHVQWRVVGGSWTNLIPLTELKGLKGDAGENAVMTIGTITTVASNAQANATVEADGVDVQGRPEFKLNLWLPKGTDGEGAGDMLKSVYDSDGDGVVDNAEKVNGLTVETAVPAGAKFTDTLTTINGKTGTIAKADIVALGIPAQDTVYTHPAGTNPHGTTKADVGLDKVDNLQQATKVEFNAHNEDTIKHITALERTAWNAKGSSNLALGETAETAYRGDRGNVAYDHSQVAHAPSNAQKNSDITKTEIEAKLTGAITSHTHSAYVPTSRKVAGKALTGDITLAKGDVGLGNVDNTSDADKPVSTAQAAAIDLKIDASKFQVVAELPASPATGVFYFVKE